MLSHAPGGTGGGTRTGFGVVNTAPSDGGAHQPMDPDVDIGPMDGEGADGHRQRGRRAQALIVLAIACGGVAGAVSRYAVSLAVPASTGQFPWGTFLINVTGSVALGFLLVLVIEQFPRGHLARPVLGTGFLGAYTTFSTFMVDAADLIRTHHAGVAVAYLAASVVAGIAGVWVGMTAARLLIRVERWMHGELP